jgi:hypothetical protein
LVLRHPAEGRAYRFSLFGSTALESQGRGPVKETDMPLVFEDDIHFDARTDDAIIWGDEGSKRFKLEIPRSVLVDKYGLEQYFDRAGAKGIIKTHWRDFEQLAQAAHDDGKSEVIVG